MANDGAVLFCDRPATAATFDAVVADLGHTRSDAQTDFEVRVCGNGRGTCVRIEGTKTLALAIARRLARTMKRSVRVFTASLVGDGDDFDCVVDDLLVAPDGSTREGRWAVDLTAEHGSDWGGICDGKAYFAVSAILDHAIQEALGEALDGPTQYLASPPSLGAPRLDDLARQARLAEAAQLTNVGGRDCIRIRNAGATITSFVSAPEAETLRRALGAILG